MNFPFMTYPQSCIQLAGTDPTRFWPKLGEDEVFERSIDVIGGDDDKSLQLGFVTNKSDESCKGYGLYGGPIWYL